MIDLVEAKLFGWWAPREGQKTDALFMIRPERENRQFEAQMMHRYGRNYLHSSTAGAFPMVMIGNPEHVVSLWED